MKHVVGLSQGSELIGRVVSSQNILLSGFGRAWMSLNSLSMHEPMLSLSLCLHEAMVSLGMLALDPNHPD